MPPAIQQKQIILSDLSVNYYTGQAKGANRGVFVFLHGWRHDGAAWFHILEALMTGGISVFCLDLPGFGKSELPAHPFTVGDYAAVVKEFIDKLQLEKVTLVGHSFGGRVAIKVAALFPDVIQKLVLVDSAGLRTLTVSLRLKGLMAKIVKPIFSLPIFHHARKAIYALMEAEDYVRNPELKQTFLNVINEDLNSLLPKINHQTLILWGESDAEVPLAKGKIMKQQIKNSELVVFPKAGHLPFYDQPEEFVQHLLRFSEIVQP